MMICGIQPASKWAWLIGLLVIKLLWLTQTSAIAEEKSATDLLYDQAMAEFKAGNKDAALKQLNQVIEQQPDRANAYWNRAVLYGENETTYSQAISDYRRYTELKPNKGDGWGSLGWFLLLQGEFSQAQAALEKRLELEPASVYSTLNLAHAHLLQGRDQQARDFYQQYLPLVPDEKLFQAGLADFDLFIEKGWKVKACKREQAWIAEQYQVYAPYRQALAQLIEAKRYQKEEDYPAALEAVERALAFYQENLPPDHPLQDKVQRVKADLHLEQGIVLQEKGQNHQAIKSFQQALDYHRDHRPKYAAHDLYRIGESYRLLQQYQQALDAYKQSLELMPKD